VATSLGRTMATLAPVQPLPGRGRERLTACSRIDAEHVIAASRRAGAQKPQASVPFLNVLHEHRPETRWTSCAASSDASIDQFHHVHLLQCCLCCQCQRSPVPSVRASGTRLAWPRVQSRCKGANKGAVHPARSRRQIVDACLLLARSLWRIICTYGALYM
jgi:hypothetical protein